MRLWALIVSALGVGATVAAEETALDRYVRKPDISYRFEVVRTIPGNGVTGYSVDLTSQTWRSPEEVDHTVWRHWLTIVRPERVRTDLALLMVGGGSMRSAPPGMNRRLEEIARMTGAVVAELRMVPNEPLRFSGESRPRTEDGIIAYTWDKFLRGGDEEWPLRLPMTKSAVRAMDAVTAAMATPECGGIRVSRFVVTGGSKRGWTTWTTAAVDKRVVAIAPAVIDVLNVTPSMDHHYSAYGFWAPAIQDYTDMKIFSWKGHPRYRELLRIEDPWEYRDRLVVPKFIVNSTGDEFFLPDSSQFYFDGLKGEKYLRYIPNSNHSLDGTDVYESLAGWFDALVQNRPRPRFEWKMEKDGLIRVKAVDPPSAVKLWQATNPEARDFRLEKIGKAWRSTPLNAEGEYYTGRVEKPGKGWTAFLVELTFPSAGKIPYKFTTPVRVVPDALPFRPPQNQK